MLRFSALIISPLFIFVSFWLFFSELSGLLWIILLAALIVLISGRILSGGYFWQFKNLWLNLILTYIAQFLFLLLLTSGALRYSLAFLLSVLWALIWWLLNRYFQNIKDIQAREYLAVNKFFYYLSFWFLACSAYSLVIFVHFPPVYALLVVLAAMFFWSREILAAQETLGTAYLIFSLFLSAQVMAILYFIPLSFYVAGTIATLWFFFIIDNTAHRLERFKLYLALFLSAIILLLITSIL